MEFDWTTFILEIVNFLILVWILKRFLYHPVLRVIDLRRAGIEKTLADAKVIEDRALTLKSQFENRLKDWEHEKELAKAKLLEETAAERERQMSSLHTTLEAEREKNRVLEERRQQEWLSATEEQAVAQGTSFAASLLSRLAGQNLENSLVQLLLEDLQQLQPDQTSALMSAASVPDVRVMVSSANRLDAEQRSAIAKAIHALTGRELQIEFSENPALIAGLLVSIGSWVLHANLRDELKFFRHSRHDS